MKIGPLSGYDAPVTFLPLANLVAGASNPAYGRIFTVTQPAMRAGKKRLR